MATTCLPRGLNGPAASEVTSKCRPREKKMWKSSLQAHSYLLIPWDKSSSRETNRFSASPELTRILRNHRVHFRTYKCPSHVPILNQIERFHTSTFHFLKIHLNVIRPSTPGSSKWSLSFRFPAPQKNPVYTSPLPHTRYMPRSSHSSRKNPQFLA